MLDDAVEALNAAVDSRIAGADRNPFGTPAQTRAQHLVFQKARQERAHNPGRKAGNDSEVAQGRVSYPGQAGVDGLGVVLGRDGGSSDRRIGKPGIESVDQQSDPWIRGPGPLAKGET